MPNEQQLSKGFYPYAQINRFVSVKNFIFTRINEKKCLLIRFSNDSDFTVESMSYTVLQLDADGNVIEKTRVKESSLNFLPGNTLTPVNALVVRDHCHDFKVIFHEVLSGQYRYAVQNGQVVAYYEKKEKAGIDIAPTDRRRLYGATFSVKPKKFGKTGVSVLTAILVLVLVIGLNIGHLLWLYVMDQEEQDKGSSDVFEASAVAEDRYANEETEINAVG